MSDLLIITPSGSLTGDKTFAGAKATFFDAGTTTPATVYSDSALTIPHASPLVAGADGLWPEIFVSGASFKVVVVYSDDTTCYTLDPCPKSQALGSSANSISFSPTASLPENNVQDALNLIGSAAKVNLNADGRLPEGVTGIGRRLVQRQTASNSPTIDFISAVLTGASGMYEIEFDGVVPATSNANLNLLTSTNGGTIFDNGAADYTYVNFSANNSTTSAVNGGDVAYFPVTVQNISNTAAHGGACGRVSLNGLGQARRTVFRTEATTIRQDLLVSREMGGGQRNATTAVNGLRLFMNSGNIAAGTFTLYEVIR